MADPHPATRSIVIRRARYKAALNLAIQSVWDRNADRLSYADLIAGLVSVCGQRMHTFVQRMENNG